MAEEKERDRERERRRGGLRDAVTPMKVGHQHPQEKEGIQTSSSHRDVYVHI